LLQVGHGKYAGEQVPANPNRGFGVRVR